MLILKTVLIETPIHNAGVQIDESLFSRISEDDKEAFLTLYEKCSSPVFLYALSILRNREDAEDAMQDTFLKIRSAAHLYKPQGKPLAWILTITKNICLMTFRKRAHSTDQSINENFEDMGFDLIENINDRLVLEKAFTVIPGDVCRIIILHAVGGMKHREIAELLELPLSTVLSKYNRGIKKLRAEMERL